MLTTTIALLRAISDTKGTPQYLGYVGFALQLTVKETTNIDPSIFVFQRAPKTTAEQDLPDEFYSIASVEELSSLPANQPTPESSFYRTNSVTMVFPTAGKAQEAQDKILSEIAALKHANDQTINLKSPTLVAFPDDSISRYWGASASDALDDAALTALARDGIFQRPMTQIVTLAGLLYVYAAYRAELGASPAIQVNGVTVPSTLVTRNVTDQYGHIASYNIYRTTDKVAAGTITIAVT